MEVTITAKHCSISESVRERALRLVRRLDRYEARATAAIVNFEAEHGQKHVDARIAVAGASTLRARADGPTFRAALDTSIDRLERQLQRHQERRRRGRSIAGRATARKGSA